MDKHGYLHSPVNPGGLALFRLDSKDITQFLGNPPYTPMYVYLSKRDGKLVELQTIGSVPSKDEFLKDLERTAKLGEDFVSKVRME